MRDKTIVLIPIPRRKRRRGNSRKKLNRQNGRLSRNTRKTTAISAHDLFRVLKRTRRVLARSGSRRTKTRAKDGRAKRRGNRGHVKRRKRSLRPEHNVHRISVTQRNVQNRRPRGAWRIGRARIRRKKGRRHVEQRSGRRGRSRGRSILLHGFRATRTMTRRQTKSANTRNAGRHGSRTRRYNINRVRRVPHLLSTLRQRRLEGPCSAKIKRHNNIARKRARRMRRERRRRVDRTSGRRNANCDGTPFK